MSILAGSKTPGRPYFIEALISPQSKSLFKTFKGRSPSSSYDTRGFLMKNPANLLQEPSESKAHKITSKFKTINSKITQSCPVSKEKPPLTANERLRLSSTIETKYHGGEDRSSFPLLTLDKRETSFKQKSANTSPLHKGKENVDLNDNKGHKGLTPSVTAGAGYIGNKALFCSNPQAKSLIKGFAADTDMGLVRNYNEDRVTVVYNYQQPRSWIGAKWPHISYFGLFDGHGGKSCADYLRDNLHNLVRRILNSHDIYYLKKTLIFINFINFIKRQGLCKLLFPR
jgi:hypothetical protein